MSPTPTSTTPSSGSGHSPEEQFRVVRKRNRVPLSCYPCRTRKKCDRGHPCSNCVKREGVGTSSCSYAAPASRKRSQAQGPSSPDEIQNRIDRLESLVLSFMHGGADASGPAAAAAAVASTVSSGTSGTDPGATKDMVAAGDGGDDDSDVDEGLASSLGVLKVDTARGRSMYVGQEHWHTILSDISEVKNFYIAHKKDLERSYEKVLNSKPSTALDGPGLLLGGATATEVELRAELPPKSTVLTLCNRYFNSTDNAVNIIHAPSFRTKLQAHWLDPSQSSVMWLGLLYSVMCLAMLSYHKVGDEPHEWKGRTLELAAEYRLRTVQCLKTGDYTRPGEYTVETMLLYVFGEYSSRWDADLGLWLISSLTTRAAIRMGYHRDGKWFPSITPFQAEMRRRTWALVRAADIIFSHQVSLPGMISPDHCDTELPHNILDDEFGPETTVLPPSRPPSESTPVSYMVAKVKLYLELGCILQATTRLRNPAHYDEIIRLDARLKAIKDELPPHLKVMPLERPRDPLSLIVARFNIHIPYLKIVCLLHRQYMSRARRNARYNYSRRSAIQASIEMLRHLADLHRESQPDGRLRSLKWFVTSIATKDFLLPTMLIVLELHYDGDPSVASFWSAAQLAEMVNSLELTKDVWKGLSTSSMEAVKAYNILEIMLDKIKNPPPPDHDVPVRDATTTAASREIFANFDPDAGMQPDHAAAMTLGISATGGLTPSTAAMFGASSGSGSSSTMQCSADAKDAYPTGMETGAAFSMDGSTFPPALSADAFNESNSDSPFSMLDSNMNLTGNFDWETFENYAQSGGWANDQSFTFFSNNPPD